MEMPLEQRLSPDERTVFDAVRTVSQRTGVPAYLVGGAIRDWLMSRPVGDLDFVVEGDAIEFTRAAQREYGGEVLAHDAFGTATWSRQGLENDIATARTETYARPAVLPAITLATIEQDLFRRDFAINAMAVHLGHGVLIDPFDGQGDLRRGVLRALHPLSFVDDPTRIFRAARYAARLGFAVDPDSRAWIDAGLPHLNSLSGERVKYDLELIFDEAEPEWALSLLRQWDVFGSMSVSVPDDDLLAGRFRRARDDLRAGEWDHASIELPPADLLHAVGWGALIHGQGQLIASRWIAWMPYPAYLRDALMSLDALSALSPSAFRAPNSRQSELLSSFGGLALYIGWLFDAHPLKRWAMQTEWRDWRRARPVTTGDDLRARGLPPGPRYGRILTRLRNAWLDEAVTSPAEEQALLDGLLDSRSVE